MASTIDKETFQRLTLFYLIGCFEQGCVQQLSPAEGALLRDP